MQRCGIEENNYQFGAYEGCHQPDGRGPESWFCARRGALEIDPNFRPPPAPWRAPRSPGRLFHWNPHHFRWNPSANLLHFRSLQGGGLALEIFENFKLAPPSKPWCPRGVGSVWLSQYIIPVSRHGGTAPNVARLRSPRPLATRPHEQFGREKALKCSKCSPATENVHSGEQKAAKNGEKPREERAGHALRLVFLQY